ncbi:MAG: hypothetical protein SFX74_08095 [Fimbriimonadaceae bacterium]|nr:hypothetical protein [Fimbriimonadaceae bacterium]
MANRVDLPEALQSVIDSAAKFLLAVGGLGSLASIGLIVFTIFRMGDPSAGVQTAEALRNLGLFDKVLLASIIGMGVGAAVMFWGEEILGVLLLLGAAALYFTPLYLPSMIPGNESNEAVRASYASLQNAGLYLGIIGLVTLAADVATRVKKRAKEGAKADQLKIGKNVKQDPDRMNVFLGKCWQLPFCRKFVREKCPIYHAKKTCWKEQVGCMCEEEVIKGAMEGRPIPKDALLADKMIPRNHKLTIAEKKERCKVCVIYNEHQRQKYRAWVPGLVGIFVVGYAVLRGPLLVGMTGVVENINRVIYGITYGAGGKESVPPYFVEMLLVVFVLVAMSYALKTLEYAIFKLKI